MKDSLDLELTCGIALWLLSLALSPTMQHLLICELEGIPLFAYLLHHIWESVPGDRLRPLALLHSADKLQLQPGA